MALLPGLKIRVSVVQFHPWPPLNQGFRAIGSTLDVEYRSDRGISGRSQFLLVRTSVASHHPPRHLAPVAVRCERQFRGEFSETPAKGINKWATAISPSSLTAHGPRVASPGHSSHAAAESIHGSVSSSDAAGKISPDFSIRFRRSRRCRAKIRKRRRRYGVATDTSSTTAARLAMRESCDDASALSRARFLSETWDCSRKRRISCSYFRASRLACGRCRHCRQIRARSPLPPNASFGRTRAQRMQNRPIAAFSRVMQRANGQGSRARPRWATLP